MKNAEKAKQMKTIPPMSVTVFGDIRWATKRPPRTAKPVQRPWPIVPPTITPSRCSLAAKTIVVIW